MKAIILLLMVTGTILHARIGETPEECGKRYGRVVERTPPHGTYEEFQKDGVKTRCAYEQGRCYSITYELIFVQTVISYKSGEEPRFSKEQAIRLLEMNASGSKWIQKIPADYGMPHDGVYETIDGKLHARINFCGVRIETMDMHKKDIRNIQPDALDQTIKSFGD